MDVKKMIDGGIMVLLLLVTAIGIYVTISVNSFVGLFVGGSLEEAANAANFSAEVQAGFASTVTNLISNIEGIQKPITFFNNLLLVIMVLAILGGIFMGYKYYMNKKDKGGDSGGLGY